MTKENAVKRRRRFVQALGSFASSTSGAGVVEFAIVTPVLVLMALGLTDYGLAVHDKMELTSAVRSGAQYALTDTDPTNIRNAVIASTDLPLTAEDIVVSQGCKCAGSGSTTLEDCSTLSCSGGAAIKEYYTTVQASHDYVPIFLPTAALTVEGSATVRTE